MRVQGMPELEPGSHANIRRQMVLSHERRAGKIAQIERLNQLGWNVRIRNGVLNCFDGKRADIAVGKSAKRGFSDADYRDRPHINLRIAPMEFAVMCPIDVRQKRFTWPARTSLDGTPRRNCTFVLVERHFNVGPCRRPGITRQLWRQPTQNLPASVWRAA